jgi:prepilin-type N-terminal cleavage/methylation domain-containing protein
MSLRPPSPPLSLCKQHGTLLARRQGMRTSLHRGFSLLETMIALVLVAVAMTALILAFVNSGQYGVLSRRQATALTVARSQAEALNLAPWGDARLTNNNAGNDGAYADPNGLFANADLPTGADAPDVTIGQVNVGNEVYNVYVNVAPQVDTDAAGVQNTNGMQFAVIVRYSVGGKFMRAVALGFRYNPSNLSIAGQLPL